MAVKAVYKYDIPIADEFDLWLPLGAQVLSFGEQHGALVLWALVDKDQRRKSIRQFRLAGTGHRIEDCERWRYVSTAITQGGALVWHLFEEDGDVRP